tara:strand:- start:3945 stop:4655 length:711 start_codon:yes stop_codon:yes gene_type:complete
MDFQLFLRIAILVIFFLFILYIIFSRITRPDGITGIRDATESKIITADDMGINTDDDQTISNQAYVSSYSVWIFVSNWQYKYGEEKIIFTKGVVNDPDIKVFLHPTQNNLVVQSKTTSTSDPIFECGVMNIPLQTWVNIVTVYNGNVLDIYVNGKLVKTCPLLNPVNINNNNNVDLTPLRGFAGNTAKFNYYKDNVSPQEVWNIYKRGFTESNIFSTNSYEVDVVVKENGELIYSS